nr:Chain B, Heat shock 70 kDa protein A [Caenorhabditis elegans]
AGGPTIEEVD